MFIIPCINWCPFHYYQTGWLQRLPQKLLMMCWLVCARYNDDNTMASVVNSDVETTRCRKAKAIVDLANIGYLIQLG